MPATPRPLYRQVGRRLAELRGKAGKTQEELAEELGVGWRYLSRVERGLENLGLDTLAKFADVFDVDIKDLFEPASMAASTVKKGTPNKRP
jgi:transcriptional regulator with XRE-family HTH domain